MAKSKISSLTSSKFISELMSPSKPKDLAISSTAPSSLIKLVNPSLTLSYSREELAINKKLRLTKETKSRIPKTKSELPLKNPISREKEKEFIKLIGNKISFYGNKKSIGCSFKSFYHNNFVDSFFIKRNP